MISKAAFEVDDYWRIVGVLHKRFAYDFLDFDSFDLLMVDFFWIFSCFSQIGKI